LGEAVEESVGCGIGGLTSVANCTGGRRNDNEEVERGFSRGKGVVEVPCTLDFGCNYGSVLIVRHLLE
jgi:hypothetical protein